MRIGIVTNTTTSIKEGVGIARYTQHLVEGLLSEGFKVELIYSKPPNVPFGEPFNHLLKLSLKTLKTKRCDLLHAVTPAAAFSFLFTEKPKVVTFHELSSLFPRIYGVSRLHYVTLLSPLWYKWGAIFCDKIIAISSLSKAYLIKYLKVPESKIAVTPLAIDDKLRLLEREVKPYKAIGYVGTLGYKKKVDYLIRAFHIFKNRYPDVNAKLLICGKKRLNYPKLVQLVRQLNLENSVKFTGFISENDLVKAYNSFDVFVFPSEMEGLGYPILEAQKCGVPVIVRAGVCIPFESSKCCIWAKSIEDMADKLHELLADGELRKALIQKGLEYASQFNLKRMISETIKVYEDALRKHNLYN